MGHRLVPLQPHLETVIVGRSVASPTGTSSIRVPMGVVLAVAAYGNSTPFRQAVTPIRPEVANAPWLSFRIRHDRKKAPKLYNCLSQ